LSVEHGDAGGDFDDLRDFTDLEGEVDLERLVDAEDGASLDAFAEAYSLGADFIGAGRELGKDEQAVVSGLYLASVTRGLIAGANECAGDGGGIRIGDDARDDASGSLAEDRSGASEQEHKAAQQSAKSFHGTPLPIFNRNANQEAIGGLMI
jgi:hypothetical protein